ncbi:MAG: autotransporter domain-containing protein [Sphingomonas sp.]
MRHLFGHRRHLLLAAVGLPGLAAALAAPASAQSTVPAPEQSILAPAAGVPEQLILSPSVVISDPGTPTTALDPDDVTGIGQMVIDQQNGFIGLCTGTLINPRTVIFAAHCVNENPDQTGFQDPWDYGAASGGLPIAFGFRANNNQRGNSAFGNWLYGGYQTDVANYLYNVNEVAYNPASTQLGLGNNFLQGDVAIATLDTPAANVPTWAILLSQLPAPDAIDDVKGTGYHVTIAGYGNNGVGDTGEIGGIDFRRRVAENYIGLLGSLDDLDSFLFGSPDGLPQNLFQLDFDDPARGTLNANIYDFNVFKDDALPSEGITGEGDSGGPLILDDTYSQKLVIAVLSGSDRFFGPQPPGSYGTTSFYQPLYLFWDWIAANNNYHYVGAKAGDGNWMDPTHWVSNIDPSYMTIENGQLVNGVPGYAGDGINGTSGKFGEICYESGATSDCYNVATGVETYNGTEYQWTPAGGTPGNNPLPDPTIDNGLPGATNFVPVDRDPDNANHVRARYFDVTLAAAGTTTLDTGVTIDRLSVIGENAKLNVTNTGSLTSLIDITQTGGLVNVDGTVTTAGDYLLMAGGLSGKGRINTPFLTSITGMIAPGGVGSVGTLTVGGDVILANGSVLMVDMAGNGNADKLAVVANPDNGAAGIASIGGSVLISPVGGYVPHYSDGATILTAEGGVDGTFAGGSLSAILYPKFTYGANSVAFTIAAKPYSSVVDTSSAVQASYASLLDRSRSHYGMLSGLYNQLDLLSVPAIQATLESMAPRTETTRTALGVMATDNMANFYRDRLTLARGGTAGGTLAMIGKPFQLAALSSSNMPLTPEVQTDAGGGMVTAPSVKLPSNVSAFIAGGYLDGHSDPMPSATAPGHDSLNGYYIAAGGEMTDDAGGVVGLSFSYSDTKGHATDAQRAKGKLYQGTLYAAADLGGLTLSSQASAGLFATETTRRLGIGSMDYTLRQHDQSLAASAEVNVGKDLGHEGGLILTPKVGLRYNHLGFSKAAETGGDAALAVHRTAYDSLQGRAGIDLGGSAGAITPRLHAAFVHDFNDQPNLFYAGFVGGGNVVAPFALASSDRNWGEVGGALRYNAGNVSFDIGVDSTIGRGDLDYRSYRGGVTFRF